MQISKIWRGIADHAKSIADMVIYLVTGESVRHQYYTGNIKDKA